MELGNISEGSGKRDFSKQLELEEIFTPLFLTLYTVSRSPNKTNKDKHYTDYTYNIKGCLGYFRFSRFVFIGLFKYIYILRIRTLLSMIKIKKAKIHQKSKYG